MARVTSADVTDSTCGSDEPEPAEGCQSCHGARYVRRNVPVGNPQFGLAVPCHCVEEEAQSERHARLLRYSNLGSLARLTFANLVPRGRSSSQQDQEVFDRCVAAAHSFAERPAGWLVMAGASGSGKTHIAAAIANRAMELGRPALFTVVPDLLDHLRSAYQPGTELGYDALFAQVRDAPLLILDDLGTQNATGWAAEKLYQLLNHRFNAVLPTVITMSVRLTEIAERIRTRLADPAVSRLFILEEVESPGNGGMGSIRFPLLQAMTLRSFTVQRAGLSEDAQASLEKAFRAALEFSERPQGWLTFIGGHGSGKTHLAAGIANARASRGSAPLFFTVADLLDLLRNTLGEGKSFRYDELFERVRSAQLLILDDLPSGEGSSWGQEKLYQLLNHRYNAVLPTVITSALRLDEIDERIASRLLDSKVGEVCLLRATDYRGEIRRRTPEPEKTSRRRAKGG